MAITGETSVTVTDPRGKHHSSVTSTGAPGDSALPDFDPAAIVELDLRDDIRAGLPPLPRILAATKELAAGGVLHLRTPFQPRPLFALLGKEGFLHHTHPFAEDDWSCWFWRAETPPPARVTAPAEATPEPEAGLLDLRLLPPPEPLLRILERIAQGAEPFDVLLPFNPELLHALLAEQGWSATLVEEASDGVRLHLAR